MFTYFFVAHSGCGFPLGKNQRFKDKDVRPKKIIPKDEEDGESLYDSTPHTTTGYITVPTEAADNAKEDIKNLYGK